MSLKIFNQPGYLSGVQSQKPSSGPGSVSAKPSEDAVARSLSVALSGASESLTSSSKDIDHVKVAKIKAALKDGTLSVNPEKIAQGLIDSALDLLK